MFYATVKGFLPILTLLAFLTGSLVSGMTEHFDNSINSPQSTYTLGNSLSKILFLSSVSSP